MKVPDSNKRKQPKQKRSIYTQELILLGAIKFIEEKGVEKINTRLISKYAGVSVGSFYQYYENKESALRDLVIYYFKRQDQKLINFIENELDMRWPLEMKIHKVLEQLYEILLNLPPISRELLSLAKRLNMEEVLNSLDLKMLQFLYSQLPVDTSIKFEILSELFKVIKSINHYYFTHFTMQEIKASQNLVKTVQYLVSDTFAN
jgi:AcrR family transcriptional regulator